MKILSLEKYIMLSAIVVISACSSTLKEPEESNKNIVALSSLPCSFPDAQTTQAPAWVCEQKVSGLTIQAMGMSDNTDAGISHQRQMAILDGQTILAAQLNSKISSAISQLSATKGMNKSKKMKRESSAQLNSSLDSNLKQMTIYQSLRSPNNIYYVLVGLNEKAYQANLTDKVNSAITDQDGWQSTGSSEQLVNDIVNYVNK